MTQATLEGRKGDLVVVSGHHVGEAERFAEILEVLGEPGSRHYSVRWNDGHESIFYPGGDVTIRQAKRRRS